MPSNESEHKLTETMRGTEAPASSKPPAGLSAVMSEWFGQLRHDLVTMLQDVKDSNRESVEAAKREIIETVSIPMIDALKSFEDTVQQGLSELTAARAETAEVKRELEVVKQDVRRIDVRQERDGELLRGALTRISALEQKAVP